MSKDPSSNFRSVASICRSRALRTPFRDIRSRAFSSISAEKSMPVTVASFG